ncbi:hypothetical protein POTOM_006050 [Populus tomentosa]|uniref:Uncharacterized protein n=1 Tax=Populus tomentosa TaxID=118781 RepID=A0A8X8ANJ3_POPTO|nr:hypothetical protein POTOM_006050 [Populus tomentosa]
MSYQKAPHQPYPPSGYSPPYPPPGYPPTTPPYGGYPPPGAPPPGYSGYPPPGPPRGYQGYFAEGYPPPPPPPPGPQQYQECYHYEHHHYQDEGCSSFLRGWALGLSATLNAANAYSRLAVVWPRYVAVVCWRNAASKVVLLH